jgi:hypothetical protein
MLSSANWVEELSPVDSLDVYRDIALMHARLAGTRGEELIKLLHRGDIRGVCEHSIDPSASWDPNELYHARQAQAFFTKIEDLKFRGLDREAAAVRSFMDSEELCSVINCMFRAWKKGSYSFGSDIEAKFYLASQKIAAVLGPAPSFEEIGYRFGGGATTKTKKVDASIRAKLASGASCSENALPAAAAVLAEVPSLTKVWADAYVWDEFPDDMAADFGPGSDPELRQWASEFWASVPVLIEDGRLEFVPKSYKTYRGVVVEPVINGIAQLGIGDIMTRRLRKAGIDLKDQTLNQDLANFGSLTGALATLDLSAASDSVALELVYHLLPLEWASLLARFRSSFVTYAGRRIKLEKFSSMGNGYTFPLESLIFWALTSACCDSHETVSVYGDDIICPSGRFDEVTELLRSAGFVVNEKKSFSTGPFRESCGSDWYLGHNVRPHYPKSWVSGRSLFLLHNYYVRRGLDEFAGWVVDKIHPSLRLWGPDGYGDGHLLGEYIPKKNKSIRDRGFAGSRFATFSLKGRRDITLPHHGDYALPAYAIYTRAAGELVPPMKLSAYRHGSFLRLWLRGHGGAAGSLPIPDFETEMGPVKATSLPGTDADVGYKRIDIYTLSM